jgi:hypothetical protein
MTIIAIFIKLNLRFRRVSLINENENQLKLYNINVLIIFNMVYLIHW